VEATSPGQRSHISLIPAPISAAVLQGALVVSLKYLEELMVVEIFFEILIDQNFKILSKKSK